MEKGKGSGGLIYAALGVAGLGMAFLLPNTGNKPPPASQPEFTVSPSTTSGNIPLGVEYVGTYIDKTTGVGIPNATVYVVVNGARVVTTATDSFGNWSADYTFTIAGTYTTYMTDVVGNQSDTITISAISPTPVPQLLMSASPTSGTGSTEVTFTGTYTNKTTGLGIPNTTLDLFVNGTNVGSFLSTSTGAFSDQYDFANAGTFVAYVSDGAVNSTPVSIVIHQQAAEPQIIMTATPSTGNAPLAVVLDGLYTDKLTGNAIPGVLLSVMANGVVVDTFTSTSAGTYTVDYSFTIAGTYTVYVTDGTVNSPSSTIIVTTPALVVGNISINQPTAITVGQTATYTGTVLSTTNIAMSGVTIYLFEGGTSTVVAQGTTKVSGQYSISVQFNVANTTPGYQIDVSNNSNNT